jgi:TonB family protein
MKLKRMLPSFVCTLGLLAQANLGALAQDKPENKPQRDVLIQRDGVTTFSFRTQEPLPDGFVMPAPLPSQGSNAVFISGGQGGDVFQFVSSEMSFDVRNIQGAPFSADTHSESVQILGDGNRIVQKQEGHVYRDGQGRTRNERSFGVGNRQIKTIHIFDHVAGANYILDPNTRIARKMSNVRMLDQSVAGVAATGAVRALPPRISVEANAASAVSTPNQIKVSSGVLQGSATKRVQPAYPPVAKAAQAQGPVQVQVTVNEAGEVTDAQVISGHPLLREAAIEAARQWTFKPTELSGRPVKVQGMVTFNFTLASKTEENAASTPRAEFDRIRADGKRESLGKQMIEGIECEGTRIVTTIPAGAIGNERPLETVREQWFAPELKMIILSKTTDPRFGESTYRLTNINRSEPDATLFQVPTDYTIKEDGYGFGFRTEPIELKEAQEMDMKMRKRRPNDQ